MDPLLLEKLAGIKILFLDVDGVLTDGGLYYTNSGEEIKKFFVRDGAGIKLLQRVGVEIAFITGLESELVLRRAKHLGVTEVAQGSIDKEPIVTEILERKNLSWDEAAFMGDDVIDLGAMSRVGFAATVADAMPEVQEAAHYTTALPGGRGAVREVCELIMKAKHLAGG